MKTHWHTKRLPAKFHTKKPNKWRSYLGSKSKKIPHIHVANERMASVQYKKKLKALGTYAGFPDLMIFLPSKTLFIEMKRTKRSLSKVSAEQEGWIEILNMFDYAKAKVCYGSGEAIDFIKEQGVR